MNNIKTFYTNVFDIPLTVNYTKEGCYLPESPFGPAETPEFEIVGVYLQNGIRISSLLGEHVMQMLYDQIGDYEYDLYREPPTEDEDEDPEVDTSTFANHDGTFADND